MKPPRIKRGEMVDTLDEGMAASIDRISEAAAKVIESALNLALRAETSERARRRIMFMVVCRLYDAAFDGLDPEDKDNEGTKVPQ
jgi:hypothetical protein